EQASSSARVTPATDRFALGLVAYRLLAGESYFRGDPIGILAQLLHEPMRAPSERHPELGKAFDGWFARACHRNPEERFASAAEQADAAHPRAKARPRNDRAAVTTEPPPANAPPTSDPYADQK